jgi:hypothetical protein
VRPHAFRGCLFFAPRRHGSGHSLVIYHGSGHSLVIYRSWCCSVLPRGDRLYDSPAVQAMVQKWTLFWVQHRRILTEDIIHVRSPSYSGIDAI